ncbi:hypothetical protein [Nocardia salmonicida]|uniref:hypothetical protein n=1 Tax=Nocardia salmonicida TaxID=53431 RepID=UPI003422FF70
MYQLIAMVQPEAHEPPAAPFTVKQAHAVMQIHVACRASRCPRKEAAVVTLVASGRMVLSPSKPR